MEHLTPFDKELDKLSDEQLKIKFNKIISNQNISPVNFFSVFAKRISFFKKIVFEEVIADKNTVMKLKMVKPSWMIMLSVLDYCENEEVLSELVKHIKQHWSEDDYISFSNYVSKEERFYKYFNK